MRPTLHARWILPFVLLAAAWALWRDAAGPRWRTLAPGVEFGTVRGDPYCRRGSSTLAIVRFDPARLRLHVRHFARISDRPLDVTEWQHATGAAVVFNAGQFYPNWNYMGLLVGDGHAISPRPHPAFQPPLAPRRYARRASRTIGAEDTKGSLIVIVTEGGYTLADLGSLLRGAPLELTQAMSMDGGLEAEMVVTLGGFHYASFGDWAPEHTSDAPGATTPLPAVITLEVPCARRSRARRAAIRCGAGRPR